MTDYEIQKATASKVGVVTSPENIYECRKAILEKLGGDSTDADTIYECDKRILPLIGSGSANLQSKSVDIKENGNTTYSPDSGFDGFSDFSVNVNVPPTPVQVKSVNITENGTRRIVPDSGYNLSSVDVNVNIAPTPTQEKSVNITENGTQRIVPDAGYNLSGVDVNVKVPLKLFNGTKFSNSTFTVCPDYDFSDIIDMSEMFKDCTYLTSINHIDTSNVTDMSYMFMFCESLETIPMLDTSNVTNVVDMFYSCQKITDLGGFTNLGKAFTSAQTLDLSELRRGIDVQYIIDTVFDMNLNTQGGSATLRVKQKVIDAMTDEQKSQLAAKGWTLTN